MALGTVKPGPPTLAHSAPGRARIHLPRLESRDPTVFEQVLRGLPGIRGVEVNTVSCRMLVYFDASTHDHAYILTAVERASVHLAQALHGTPRPKLPVRVERKGTRRRIRIPVHGLEQPGAASRAEECLRRLPLSDVRASGLTGRVLVEFAEGTVAIAEVLAELTTVGLAPVPEWQLPTDPFESGQAVESITRVIGGLLGVGILVARQLLGRPGPISSSRIFTTLAELITVLRGFPGVRTAARRVLPGHGADTVFSAAGILALTLSRSPLGLAVLLVEGMRLLTAVRARQASWRLYEERADTPPSPASSIVLTVSERAPLPGRVREGAGTAWGPDATFIPVKPGALLPAGSRIVSGSCRLDLFVPSPPSDQGRLPAPRVGLYERYLLGVGPSAIAAAVITGVITRSWLRALEALALVNARTALIGVEAADLSASASAARLGLLTTNVAGRPIRRPDVIVVANARMLSGLPELANVVPLQPDVTKEEALALAAAVSSATAYPWGPLFPRVPAPSGAAGRFDGKIASAEVNGLRVALTVLGDDDVPPTRYAAENGEIVLQLSHDPRGALAVLIFRPTVSRSAQELVKKAAASQVSLIMCNPRASAQAMGVGARAGVPVTTAFPLETVHRLTRSGPVVWFVGDSVDAGPAFSAGHFGIALWDGRRAFDARADVLVPDIVAVAELLDIGRRRDRAVRDATMLSVLSNVVGAGGSLRPQQDLAPIQIALNLTSLTAIADAWLRLQQGVPRGARSLPVADPHPERWGEQSPEQVLAALKSRPRGLTHEEARARLQQTAPSIAKPSFASVLLEQLQSPFVAIMGVGALVSLMAERALDVAILGATILANALMGAFSEHRVGQAAALLEGYTVPQALVRREGTTLTVQATEVVPGEILILTPGVRLAADARLIEAENLQVDESALTGESLPVEKRVEGMSCENRVVFAGSDVVAGRGLAVAVAVQQGTRVGATALATEGVGKTASRLDGRLADLLRISLPFAGAAGLATLGSGLLRRQPLLESLALGTATVITAVPEGLPFLARVGEAAAGRRLARRRAFVKGLGAVEALGRVDVVCADKTGTLTMGRFAVQVISDLATEGTWARTLSKSHRRVLLVAARASPKPGSDDARAHPTDRVVLQAAEQAGIPAETLGRRDTELPFDPGRGYHATWVDGRVYVKGAPEELLHRCRAASLGGHEVPLDDAVRDRLLSSVHDLARRGMRVLLVADGVETPPGREPLGLVVLGMLGIGDEARATAATAVQRCHRAGIRVIMVTGDHPETARAVARDVGLDLSANGLITGAEIGELPIEVLSDRLEQTSVIARATPLDKLRIVQALQRKGHVVAMTGDGANDGPALRAADVGIAMGHGTEVAWQAAHLVLLEDDFTLLVDALIEGRSFWRNVRRSIALLLGGNLGELLSLAGPVVVTGTAPLTTRQLLVVNLITDLLPALVIATQPPEHDRLHQLAREGEAALEGPLRRQILRRALAVSAPTMGAYFVASRHPLGLTPSGTAFVVLVISQLAHTLDSAWLEGTVNWPVVGAVGASAGLLALAMTVRPIGVLLELTRPVLGDLPRLTGAIVVSLVLNRLLGRFAQGRAIPLPAGRPPLALHARAPSAF